VNEKQDQGLARKTVHRRVLWLTALVVLLYDVLPLPDRSSGLWVAVYLPLIWLWIAAPSWMAFRPKAEHAPGFTTNRERIALGVFGAVIALRWQHDARIRQQQQQQQAILDQQSEILYRLNNRGPW
jgi:hypothetical protein